MPLKSGSSIETIGGNIGDMIDKYKETGKIGNITPKSMAHAQQIATAAANQKAGDAKPSLKKVGSYKNGGMNEGAGDMDMEKSKREVAESIKESGKEAGDRIVSAAKKIPEIPYKKFDAPSIVVPKEFKKIKKMK